MRNTRWMGALTLAAAVVLVLGAAACGREADDTATTEPTDQMGTTGTTDTTGAGTMDTTGSMGTGAMGATDDATLQTSVQNAISIAPGMTGVTVTVAGGTITLAGTVATEADKTAAESTAKSVPGVVTVVNSLTVGPPAQ